uniref:Multiple epidermal growth factor-like domains protein 11 n=1 Tax=Sipha flava TaxID=143950 RepID=A0A2S2QCB1_9HEMI
MTSFTNTVVVLLFLWTFALEPCRCDNHTTDCFVTESYHEVVTVSVNEPVHIIRYTWCLNIPPRCPDNRQEYRTIHKNITVPKTRRKKVCCENQIQLYEDCIPKCTEEQCLNIKCVPGTARCKCKSGFVGQLCQQRCDVGYWGPECKNRCDVSCSECDHHTGCCLTAAGDDHTALIMCVTDRPTANRLKTSVAGNGTERENGNAMTPGNVTTSTDDRSLWPARTPTTRTPTTQTPTMQTPTAQTPTTQTPTTQTPTTQTPTTPTRTTAVPKRRNDGMIGMFYGKVDVMIYDQLVKKLIWISAMTVVAIAMVFVIMFVVFINFYGANKRANVARDRRRPTSLDLHKINEKCIITQNPGYVSPDRYSKTPMLHTSNNGYTTFHPEIFCPVFSAPHHTGGSSLLYDTPRPQPVYEMLS